MLGYFLRHCKRHANIPHNIPNEIRNNINKCDHEAGLYSQVAMKQRQTNVDKEQKYQLKIIPGNISKEDQQDHKIGSNLILYGL